MARVSLGEIVDHDDLANLMLELGDRVVPGEDLGLAHAGEELLEGYADNCGLGC